MKRRIRCPKCDEPIVFDDSLYEPGRSLVFECASCHKQFRIRIPDKKEQESEIKDAPVYGSLVVIENAFHPKQEIMLREGANVIGRGVKGTSINAPIMTVDPSMDTTHCIITVKVDKKGNAKFILRDAPSNTGTFLSNEILADRDRVYIDDGAIITIGATTLILKRKIENKEDA